MSSTARITDTGRKGDLRIAFGFARQDNGRTEPVMYIGTVRSPQVVASIPISLMYLFDTRDAAGTREALVHARKIAEAVYGHLPSRADVHRVLDAVTDWITDLKNMPPPSTWRNPETLAHELRRRGYDMVA